MEISELKFEQHDTGDELADCERHGFHVWRCPDGTYDFISRLNPPQFCYNLGPLELQALLYEHAK